MALTSYQADLLELMPDTITVEPYTGKDAHGNEVYGTPFTVRANVQSTIRRGTTGDQEGTYGPPETVTGTVICIASGITPRDKITLPGISEPKYADDVTVWRDAPESGPAVEELTFKEQS